MDLKTRVQLYGSIGCQPKFIEINRQPIEPIQELEMGKRLVAVTIDEWAKREGVTRQAIMKRIKKEGLETFKKANSQGREVLHVNIEEALSPEEETRTEVQQEVENTQIVQWNKALEREQQLNLTLQRQLEDQRSLLETLAAERRAELKGSKWQLPAVVASILIVGGFGLWTGWSHRADMADKQIEHHKGEVSRLMEGMKRQEDKLEAIQEERLSMAKKEAQLEIQLNLERNNAQEAREQAKKAKEELSKVIADLEAMKAEEQAFSSNKTN
jgi:signal transduction histidine kinase